MHNGNLHNALLRRKSPELVRWQTRFSVALGVVRGLQFLHSCNPPVIHDDIKPINVLLDWSFAAKIGDFGLARFRTENRLEAEALSYESDVVKKNGKGVGGNLVNEENGGSSGVMLKDYVMDWIRNDVGMQRPKAELTASASAASTNAKDENNNKKKHKSNSSSSMRKLEWWESMDEDGDVLKKQRRRPVREWWKEEYSQDLA
nr:receptor-like serine/threonine-protein kinase At4g25390 [Arachis hypogaea]